MMNLHRQFFVAFLALAISACSMFQPKPIPERVNDGYIAITAAAQEIKSGLDQGYYTKDEAKGYVDSLADAKSKLDKADEFIKLGDLTLAENQIRLANAAMGDVRKWLNTKKGEKK